MNNCTLQLGDIQSFLAMLLAAALLSACGPGLENPSAHSGPGSTHAGLDGQSQSTSDASVGSRHATFADASADPPDYFAWKNEGFIVPEHSRPTIQLAAGYNHSCALHRKRNEVRCWGNGEYGQLGYASTDTIGDDEVPRSAGVVDISRDQNVVQIAAGGHHSCALLRNGAVRCWGSNEYGQLGYGHTDRIGDDETPASAGDVPLGNAAIALALGAQHSCALLRSGAVRCWGNSKKGRLGYGRLRHIGDDEYPAVAGSVSLGGRSIALTAGWAHSCALLEDHRVRCWGANDGHQLGFGFNTLFPKPVGDDERPIDGTALVELGGSAIGVSCDGQHCCALLSAGNVRCWGRAAVGQIGYDDGRRAGSLTSPRHAGDVPIGGVVAEIITADRHTCARLLDGRLRCFGSNLLGAVGVAINGNIGTRDHPMASVGFVDVGGVVESLALGGGVVWNDAGNVGQNKGSHTCVALADQRIRCWGLNHKGQLGYPGVDKIGLTDTPEQFGQDLDVFPRDEPATPTRED